LLLLPACDRAAPLALDATPPPEIAPDASPPPTIHFAAANAVYFAYREGDGAWRQPDPDADGARTLDVTGDHTVIAVCRDAGTVWTYMFLRTRADGNGAVWCPAPSAPLAAPLPGTPIVRGKMSQAGEVVIGHRAQRSQTAA